MTIRVLIADDQELVRAGFRKLLDAEDTITVVGEAADGAQAVARATELSPDVVLMDIRMPRLDGIEATRRLTRSSDVQVPIKTYVGNILMKLGCRDRVQAVVAAYEAGLVRPGRHG
jgi:DNA-binding NarL/FixJ family response regulator